MQPVSITGKDFVSAGYQGSGGYVFDQCLTWCDAGVALPGNSICQKVKNPNSASGNVLRKPAIFMNFCSEVTSPSLALLFGTLCMARLKGYRLQVGLFLND